MSRQVWLVSGIFLAIAAAGCAGASAQPSASAAASSATIPPTTTPDPTTGSPAPIEPPTVDLEEVASLQLDLRGGPDWPTELAGSVWILAPDAPLTQAGGDALVHRLDPQSGEELARVAIGGRLCQGIAAGFGSLWACGDDGLKRIDPTSNQIVAEVAFPTAQVYLRPVMSEERVWMLAGNVIADSVVEIDPATNTLVATHQLGRVPTGLAYGGGAVWVTIADEGLLLRIDPDSGEVMTHADGLTAPGSIAYGAGSLWVGLYAVHGGETAAPGEPTIARLSAADGMVQALIDTGSTTMSEGDIWATDHGVWIRVPGDPFLLHIDPARDEVTWAVAGFHSGGSLAVIDGSVWTTSTEFQNVWRIDL